MTTIDQKTHESWAQYLPEEFRNYKGTDGGEPIFVVPYDSAAQNIRVLLNFDERLKNGDIGKWYFNHAFFRIEDGAERTAFLKARLTPGQWKQIGRGLSWKPLVLTFKDEEVERELSRLCTQVSTIELEKLTSYEEFEKLYKTSITETEIGFKDMPESVLDGWLGEICRTRMADFPRAYAWPALLVAASVLVTRHERHRENLFVALVGPKGTGKSSAFDVAFKLLSIQQPPLMRLKAGSAEGLVQYIGDIGGAPRLFFTDELAHLLKKASIEGSTFSNVLNSTFYNDKEEFLIARGKRIEFNCRLSIAGGLIDEQFGELFGAETTNGFYDRFVFGQCPTGYSYNYEPFEGPPAIQKSDIDEPDDMARPLNTAVEINPDVWRETKRWRSEFGLNREVENAIKAASICAAFDGRTELRVSDLGPALEFAQYQARMRKVLEPNPGKTPDAIVSKKIKAYLCQHAANGEWMNRRRVLHNTRAYDDWGPNVCDRALAGLEFNGDIEQSKIGRQRVIRLNLDRV